MKPLPFPGKPKPKPNGRDTAVPSKPRAAKGNGHGGDRTWRDGRRSRADFVDPLADNSSKRGRPKITDRQKARMLAYVAERAVKGKQVLPLEFMMSTLNSVDLPWKCRAWAAKEAAPYLHRRMPIAIEGGDANRPLVFATASQLQGLPTAQLEVAMQFLSRFSREELAKHTGVSGLLPSTIDNATGEVSE
jgi:hypothetical protein